MNKIKYIAAVLIAIAGMGLQQAKADLFTSELNIGPNDSTGILYGTVTVSLTGQVATITFNSNTALDYWFIDSSIASVNVNASTFDFAIVNDPFFSNVNIPGGNVNGFGSFDLSINNLDGWGSKIDTLSFTVTNTSGVLWNSASNVLEFNGDGFDASAHVATLGGSLTFFVAENGTNVPDGGTTVMLLGLSFGALGIARRFLMR
jgi:protein with PEP-CTERM/exosortase system signal